MPSPPESCYLAITLTQVVFPAQVELLLVGNSLQVHGAPRFGTGTLKSRTASRELRGERSGINSTESSRRRPPGKTPKGARSLARPQIRGRKKRRKKKSERERDP